MTSLDKFMLTVVILIASLLAAYFILTKLEDKYAKTYYSDLEIYTPLDIYYIDYSNKTVMFESNSDTLTFNSYLELKEYISNKTAADTAL